MKFNRGTAGKQTKNASTASAGDRRELGKKLLDEMTMNMENDTYKRVEIASEIVANGVGGKTAEQARYHKNFIFTEQKKTNGVWSDPIPKIRFCKMKLSAKKDKLDFARDMPMTEKEAAHNAEQIGGLLSPEDRAKLIVILQAM